VKVQACLDRQVALAADLAQGGPGRPSIGALDVERQAVMRLFDRPGRIEVLTRPLDRPERAFVRNQLRRGGPPAELSRGIFVARLLASEPSTRGVPQALAKTAEAAALRPLLSALSDPRRMGWAKVVADAVAAHQQRLIFEDPFPH
jgi:hypothetical protein